MATTTDPQIFIPPDAPEVQPLVIPAIQLRATYPAGVPPLGGPPKAFGKTPTSVNQIMYPISGMEPTHFQGPLVSGVTPGVQGAGGTAQLCLALQVDWSMGNFNLPIQFPGGSLIQSISAYTYEAGLGALVVCNFGTQQGGSDIGVITLPAVYVTATPVAPTTVNLPWYDKVCPICPFQCWLQVTANTGHTAGGAVLLVTYIRLASPWSPAAK